MEGLVSVRLMAGIAEGSRVWLPDGSVRAVEEVASGTFPVLSYSKKWDTRPVRYGANQGPRDHSVGELVQAIPTHWQWVVVGDAYRIEFVSGRTVEAGPAHRWVTQRRKGRQAWEWRQTSSLHPGDRVPVPLTAGRFGSEGNEKEGYFVGAMLGDGGMTSCTPEFHGDPQDGAVAFMRGFARGRGCEVREIRQGAIVRLRFPFKAGQRNPMTELLRAYGIWGKRCERKTLPDLRLGRSFWIGCLSGLVDTDGCVRERVNPRGTVHGSVEYGTVSRDLALGVSDLLLRFGIVNRVREVSRNHEQARFVNGYEVRARRPIYMVEITRAVALQRLADLLRLRIGYKARKLAKVAHAVGHVNPARSEMHGYDDAVALDRVKSVTPIGSRRLYGADVSPSHLFVVNGLVVGAM